MGGQYWSMPQEQSFLEVTTYECRTGIPLYMLRLWQSGTLVGEGIGKNINITMIIMMMTRNAGRRRDWEQLTLVSTLSPCIMCTGATLLYKIKRVVVGENINFSSFAEGVMASQGVQVHLIQDSSCIEMMKSFIKERNDLWQEDIHDI